MGGGNVTSVMSSPGISSVSTLGVVPGSRWKSAIGITLVWPLPRTVPMDASKARNATAISPGFVAMQSELPPITANCRLNPLIAAQPDPGCRLLQAIRIVEIWTARALEQVAARCRFVPQLARRTGNDRARKHPIVSSHPRIGSKLGICDQCADTKTSVSGFLYAVETNMPKVDQMSRRFYLKLHEIDQIGAPGNEFRALSLRSDRSSLGGTLRSLVGELFHARLPATSAIASAIFE
jgi:hypothetical protein